MSERVKWIDAAKGLGIILVVMSHAPIEDSLRAFLFAFHMPLFFYLSGVVFRPRDVSIGAFMKKKARSLLLPYLLFSIVTYMIWFFATRHFPFTSGEGVNPLVPLSGIFLSTPENYQLTYNPAIWFLTCLFVVELLFFLYYRLSGGRFLVLFLLLCAIGGYGASVMDLYVPWNGVVAVTAVVFYGLGFLTKHLWRHVSWVKVLPLITGLLLFTNYIQSLNSERIDMRGAVYGEFGYFYLAAFAGMVATILLCMKLERSSFLIFLGQNSIVILLLHFTGLNLVRALVHYGFGYEISATTSLPWTLFYTACTLLLMWPCIKLLKKIPWVLGKSPSTPVRLPKARGNMVSSDA
ncbi:acyltransferase family protein [Shouchella shacheensis]|uniref:acyltransferase family protein n=1 Tax=Shouchella shacheensis TaxID=1649580 RepID=UPI0009E9FA0E|nr:acyltransferase family protein [Shouchella shacheensis]